MQYIICFHIRLTSSFIIFMCILIHSFKELLNVVRLKEGKERLVKGKENIKEKENMRKIGHITGMKS